MHTQCSLFNPALFLLEALSVVATAPAIGQKTPILHLLVFLTGKAFAGVVCTANGEGLVKVGTRYVPALLSLNRPLKEE